MEVGRGWGEVGGLKIPTSLQLLNNYLVPKNYMEGDGPSPAGVADQPQTCIMPYDGVITSSLRKREEPAYLE